MRISAASSGHQPCLRLSSTQSDYSKKAEIIDQLLIGMEDRRAVFITYQSLRATESITYDTYPLPAELHPAAFWGLLSESTGLPLPTLQPKIFAPTPDQRQSVSQWTLTTLREKLIKIGAKVRRGGGGTLKWAPP